MKHVLGAALIVIGFGFGIATRADLTPSLNQTTVPPSTLAVTALSASATTVTATLPLVSGQFHYITSVLITRSCTTAITGTALLAVTTTNLPGSLAWTAGNACTVGSTNIDVNQSFSNPLKSSVAGTATTIVAPSAGTAGFYRIVVTYYAAP